MKATRILALLLAMLMALALFACDNGNADTEAPSQNATRDVCFRSRLQTVHRYSTPPTLPINM